MKKTIKKLFEIIGYQISRYSDKTDAFKMQKQLIGNTDNKVTIVDAGAYIGDVTLIYNKLFPNCEIFSFEPFYNSFLKLQQNTSLFKNITVINKGLADQVKFSKFQSNRWPDTNSIFKSAPDADAIWASKGGTKGKLDTIETIEVEITTVDDFVQTHAIDKIDILKMDVQGAEYLILNGATKSLNSGIIKLIYLEIITLPSYEGQIYFDETVRLIRSFGFELFNFYNYSLTDAGKLRMVDAIFVKR
ncbi:MAG: FkbM family methyltransferase [Bacteroidetes bacterium]|nr:FkbM family methyltransferase [Bacteroidota bacterium]